MIRTRYEYTVYLKTCVNYFIGNHHYSLVCFAVDGTLL